MITSGSTNQANAKNLISEELLIEIANKYVSDKVTYNMARLSSTYDIPYSTLRRHLLAYIALHNLDEMFKEDHLDVEFFPDLQVGDTYQYADHLIIWKVKERRKMDGDLVWVATPVKMRSPRHWANWKLVDGRTYVSDEW